MMSSNAPPFSPKEDIKRERPHFVKWDGAI